MDGHGAPARQPAAAQPDTLAPPSAERVADLRTQCETDAGAGLVVAFIDVQHARVKHAEYEAAEFRRALDDIADALVGAPRATVAATRDACMAEIAAMAEHQHAHLTSAPELARLHGECDRLVVACTDAEQALHTIAAELHVTPGETHAATAAAIVAAARAPLATIADALDVPNGDTDADTAAACIAEAAARADRWYQATAAAETALHDIADALDVPRTPRTRPPYAHDTAVAILAAIERSDQQRRAMLRTIEALTARASEAEAARRHLVAGVMCTDATLASLSAAACTEYLRACGWTPRPHAAAPTLTRWTFRRLYSAATFGVDTSSTGAPISREGLDILAAVEGYPVAFLVASLLSLSARSPEAPPPSPEALPAPSPHAEHVRRWLALASREDILSRIVGPHQTIPAGCVLAEVIIRRPYDHAARRHHVAVPLPVVQLPPREAPAPCPDCEEAEEQSAMSAVGGISVPSTCPAHRRVTLTVLAADAPRILTFLEDAARQ